MFRQLTSLSRPWSELDVELANQCDSAGSIVRTRAVPVYWNVTIEEWWACLPGAGLLAGVAEGIINDKVKDALSSNDVHASRPVVTEQRATSMNRSHPQPFSRTAPLRSAKGS